MAGSKSDTGEIADKPGLAWPAWLRRLVTIVIVFHVAAVVAGAFGTDPSSELEHGAADLFTPYHQLLDQGDGYRYYSTAFPPVPVITATLNFKDGRPDQEVRIPDRSARPRLLYQRQLALANGLMQDFYAAKQEANHDHPMHEGHSEHEKPQIGGESSKSRWAHAFATHLGKTHPGCKAVTLRLEMHLVPRLERVRELLDRPGGGPVDLNAEEFLMTPERIGVYPCDAS
jgi:hypothetical protein